MQINVLPIYDTSITWPVVIIDRFVFQNASTLHILGWFSCSIRQLTMLIWSYSYRDGNNIYGSSGQIGQCFHYLALYGLSSWLGSRQCVLSKIFLPHHLSRVTLHYELEDLQWCIYPKDMGILVTFFSPRLVIVSSSTNERVADPGLVFVYWILWIFAIQVPATVRENQQEELSIFSALPYTKRRSDTL